MHGFCIGRPSLTICIGHLCVKEPVENCGECQGLINSFERREAAAAATLATEEAETGATKPNATAVAAIQHARTHSVGKSQSCMEEAETGATKPNATAVAASQAKEVRCVC